MLLGWTGFWIQAVDEFELLVTASNLGLRKLFPQLTYNINLVQPVLAVRIYALKHNQGEAKT